MTACWTREESIQIFPEEHRWRRCPCRRKSFPQLPLFLQGNGEYTSAALSANKQSHAAAVTARTSAVLVAPGGPCSRKYVKEAKRVAVAHGQLDGARERALRVGGADGGVKLAFVRAQELSGHTSYDVRGMRRG